MKKIIYPTNFAVSASFIPTDALFYAKNSAIQDEKLVAIEVVEKTVLGTLSNESKTKDIEKAKNGEIVTGVDKANIQTVDHAFIPKNKDTLVIKWNLKILPDSLKPHSCNELEYRSEYDAFINAFKSQNGFDILAERYAEQILNGSWFWRNIDGLSLKVKVSAKTKEGQFTSTFDDGVFENKEELIYLISQTLSGKNPIAFLNVTGEVLSDELVQVYPSEEFQDKEDKKVLYSVFNDGIKQAAMHSQKIGNAIRTIDDWYSDNAERKIPVEPFGVEKRISVAHRSKDNHLYVYLRKINEYTDSLLKDGIKNEHLFIAACLIRGGVFGGKS